MWIKYSLPRIRIDHMLAFNWKFLTPLSLSVLIVTAILSKILEGASEPVYVISMLLANLLIAVITLAIVRRYAKVQRNQVAEFRPVAAPENAPVTLTNL